MYIQLISIHGLIRGESVEMGRDADTGGQIRYVLELSKMLSECDEVESIDFFTRQIRDKRVSDSYAEEIEQLNPKLRIIRLACGGGKYIRKERLWPHLDEYVDAMISFTRRQGRLPTVVHGNYADAGYVAKEVAAALDVPFVFTGHALGLPKLDYLLEEGLTREEANREFSIDHRIQVEQECLSQANLVITSTRHERDQQYGRYPHNPGLRFEVIPPGTDLKRFFPYYDYDLLQVQIDEQFKQARIHMLNELSRFLFQREKPLILSLCRPDHRKNVAALIKAFGESKELQAMANLVILAGIRDDIEAMPETEKQVLTDMLLAMDRHDLYGKMALPKNHDSEFDVPELYRIAASSHGIFVNPAFSENFGLTAIEALAVGLPFVSTGNGGPQDIVQNCQSGLLVDVTDQTALTQAMIKLLTDQEVWHQHSINGINLVRKHYSWTTHCAAYLSTLKEVVDEHNQTPSVINQTAPGRRLAALDYLLITDIDNTLLGDDQALENLKKILAENHERIGFGVASGRGLELIQEALAQYGIAEPDVIIAAVGSEIYYGRDCVPDKGWTSHLRSIWQPEGIHQTLDSLPFLHLQTQPTSQRQFKISYYLDDVDSTDEAIRLIQQALSKTQISCSLIHSHGALIDILPRRASKGKAVRYFADKWNIPLQQIVTAGDSGNDRDMLTGPTSGIVVGNHDEEMKSLPRSKSSRIYYAKAHCAGGIIEGLEHYGVISKAISVGAG